MENQIILNIMKCSIQTFILGMLVGAFTGMYAERYSRTTMKGRKIRRDIDRTVRNIYGEVEQEIGKLKEKIGSKVEKAEELVND